MSKPDKGDIKHRKGWRQRVRVRGRELERKQPKPPKAKPRPIRRKRT